MAEIETHEMYNGVEWYRVISEKIYNEDGEPTNHYKEIDRQYIVKLGILDKQEILQQCLTDLVNLRIQLPVTHNYFILRGKDYCELYKTFQASDWASIGRAVVGFFAENNIIIKKYETFEDKIIFTCYTRPDYEDFFLTFSSADDIIQPVP